MKKNIILAMLALALSFTAQAQTPSGTLTLAPAPAPHASGKLTEAQFATLLSGAPANAVSGASTTVQSISFFGTHLSINGVPAGGIIDTKQMTLTAPQIATLLAGLPALPSGEVAANIRSFSAFRNPAGVNLQIQFSK